MSVNRVTISGNVGRDPELRATNSGMSILSFSVAVNDRVKKGDNWEDYTNWVDVVVFGRRADSLSKFLSKGMKVAVDGKLRYSSWERDGQKRSKIEVIADDIDIMQRRDGDGGRTYGAGNGGQANNSYGGQVGPQNGSQGPTGAPQQQQFQQQYASDDVYDYDIPFD